MVKKSGVEKSKQSFKMWVFCEWDWCGKDN
jgi:hypothetical protein